jgi:hypothetical protein
MSSPQNPETRGAWLWRKMMNVYGARFLDMWEGVDVAEMQATWTDAMRGTTREALQRGVSALWHTKRPPTLPEFLELCRPGPTIYRQHTLALTNDANRTPPEQAREQLATIRDLAGSTVRSPDRNAGVQWAHRLLRRAADGERVTQHQIESAQTAIEAWECTHGRIERDREPGSDDESTNEDRYDDPI